MTDIIFKSPDYATMLADAERLEFLGADGSIIQNGAFPTGGGWFLNMVGTVSDENGDARPGFWGRLRLNGIPDNLPSFSSAIEQYAYSAELGGWTKDGVTLAPDWVGNVAPIL